jgi:hypothetical protein
MQALIEPRHAAVPHSHGRPRLDSYDSCEEFSFYHWIEVSRLVDEGDTTFVDEGLPCTAEFEEALEETMSEVEPATAYQNFAGNVV